MKLIKQTTILTIDDEAVIRRSIHAYLEDYDYRVLEAANGAIGIDLVAREKIDLVLVDLRMPEMGGLQVLAHIRRTIPDLPVIVVSGAGDLGDVVEALRLGAWDYLMKPINDMSILKHAIEQGLERARLIEENKRYQSGLEEIVSRKTQALTELNLRLCDVVETTKTLLGCGDLDDSGAMILKEFAGLVDARGGSIYEVRDSGLHLIASLDKGHPAAFLSLPLSANSVFARVLAGREPVLVTDITASDLQPSGYSRYRDNSCLIFPLIDREGSAMAIISLHDKRTPPFAVQDREIGAILASYASEALQTARAIAALQHSEELMLQAQKMEAIGTLAGGIAHDFNNILSAIVGYTDLSLFGEDCPEDVRRNLEQIRKGSMRARDLVRQILSFSRTDEHTEGPIDISPIIKEAMKLLRASIPSSITIQRDIPSGLGLIRIGPSRIHQVIMNLCTNAAQAMQGGTGVLSVDFSRVRIDEEPIDLPEIRAPICLKLSVADTGIGMSPEIAARIFDPYFTTKEKGEGTGLGLAVVHGIVRASGGTIRVESKEGGGSRFHIYFPIIEMAAGETAAEGLLEMPGGTEKILIVDDEETLAVMAGEMLQKLGYTVEVMTNSVAALQRYLSRPFYFDMVITDQTMPDLGGMELAREILAVRPSIPVILYTGYSASVNGHEAKRIGIREFMMKPLSMTHLALTVRRVLNSA